MKTIKMTYGFGLLLAVAMLTVRCSTEPPVEPTPPPVDPSEAQAFLIYDNIGDPYFTDNVNAAGAAVADGALLNGQRVIVFHRQQAGNMIYELVKSNTRQGFAKQVLKRYPSGQKNALSKEDLAGVVADVRELVPADHYGLAFGSHGLGWIPRSYTGSISRRIATPDPVEELLAERENPLTRYLSGYGQKIDVSEFADALDEWQWDFIIFDDCFMASIEALYEIRHLADYFIASPTEIMMYGFPYDRVVSTIFEDWSDFAGVGREYVSFYRSRSSSPFATVAVVKASELDALASTVRDIWRSGNFDNFDPAGNDIQYYEGLTNGHIFYDFGNYIGSLDINPALRDAFKAQLNRTVVYKDHTERFYSDFGMGQTINVEPSTYSGLNAYIPWGENLRLMDSYRRTAWYTATRM